MAASVDSAAMSARRALCTIVLLLSCVLGLPGGASAGARAELHYAVAIPAPHRQYVEVEVRVPAMRGKTVDLAMPAWTPGSYLVRDFGRHVYDTLATTAHGRVLPVDRVDKQTWRVQSDGAEFSFRYRVFADELSVRTSYVDSRFAVLNGTSVFMYVVGQLDRPAVVSMVPPRGWAAHTALPSVGSTWRATDYDTLADSPFVLGRAQVHRYRVGDTTVEYVYLAPNGSNADVPRLVSDSRRLVASFAELMGGMPLSQYKFLVVATPNGRGGLEHLDSTLMLLRSHGFDSEDGYRYAAGLAAHEFFHLWNVKRIHDPALGPFDYTKENYTDLLWFHEGFTSAMAPRALLHAGLTEPAEYLEDLEDLWHDYLARPGRDYEPLTQVSRDAWIKGYKPARNHRDVTISYYDKGELLGVLLDLELHRRSAMHDHRGSLAGLFARLWRERPAGASRRAVTMVDIVRAATAEAGEDMAWFFDRFVEGTEPLPLPAALLAAGVEVEAKAAWAVDADATRAERRAADRKRAWAGIVGSKAGIVAVVPGSPADRAGMALGDEAVAVDGVRTNDWRQAMARMADRRPGEAVTVAFYRGGRLETRAITLAPNPYQNWTFTLPDEGIEKLDRWLYRGD
ncbi:MAG: M61 family metallopeptidase [Myxococcales bacterium FL481]|nr:MAG: M61 family metallopeptidase [Myxococcales bacterium FL481]